MARQWPAVPAEQRHRLALGHAGADAGQQRAHSARRLAAGPLERGDLLGLVDDPQAFARIDEEVGRIFDRAAIAHQVPQLVEEVRRQVAHARVGVRLPADDADARTRPDSLGAENLGERQRAVARLVRQAEVLEPMPPQYHGRRTGDAPALVADEHGGLCLRADDEERLLEARVEPGQVRPVCAVLAIGIDDDAVVSTGVGSLA